MSVSNDDLSLELRPWRQILFYGLTLGLFLAFVLTYYGLRRTTHRVEVWVESDLASKWMVVVALRGDAMVDGAKIPRAWERHGPHYGYRSDRIPITGLVLFTPAKGLDTIERVTIRMQLHRVTCDRARFQSEWSPWEGARPKDVPADWEGRVFRTPLHNGGSLLPPRAQAINCEGDAALARFVFLSPIFIAYAIGFGLLVLLRCWMPGRLVHALSGVDEKTANAGAGWGWMLAGLAVLCAAGVMLEQQQPYYFTQDDNFSQFLPNILYGCDAARAGALPTWNPHQFLGAPLAELGTYALTYPGTYLSYWIASDLIGDRNATIEVFCWLHLVLGYLVLCRLGSALGLVAPLASAFALCQVLSGYALVCGRSWYYMAPVYLWMPLLLLLLLHARDHKPTWRWTLGTGLAIGLFFHAGNAQMWVYAVGLSGIFVLWNVVNRSLPWQRAAQMVPAGLMGLGIAAVLLVPQLQATRDLRREGGEGWDIQQGVLALFVPYPIQLDFNYEPEPPRCDPQYLGTLFYAGTVFSVAWVIVLLLGALRRGNDWHFLRDPWNGLAIITLLLALGDVGLLWTAQAQLPVLKQLNHAKKFLPFFHLFSCAAGAVLVNRAIRLSPRPSIGAIATFSIVAVLLLYHAFFARVAFFVFADSPYPPLPPAFAPLQRDDVRILPLTLIRSDKPNYVAALQHQFPTLCGINSIGGYDPLVERDAYYREVMDDLDARPNRSLRTHGVTHVVVHREYEEAIQMRDWPTDQWRWHIPPLATLLVDFAKAKPVMESDGVRVYAIDGSRPIASLASKPQQAIPSKVVPAGIDVDLPELPREDEVMLNFVWRPGIRVYADGVLADGFADEDQHIRVPVRAGMKQLSVRYESPWSTGFLCAGVLVGLALIGAFVARRFDS